MSLQGSKGEVLFDNRSSGQGVTEFWTLTCSHCGVVRYVDPFRNEIVRMRVVEKVTPQPDGSALREIVSVEWKPVGPPSVCRKCMAYLCDTPACHKECLPVDAGIDLILAKDIQTTRPFAVDDRTRQQLFDLYQSQRLFPGVTLDSKE